MKPKSKPLTMKMLLKALNAVNAKCNMTRARVGALETALATHKHDWKELTADYLEHVQHGNNTASMILDRITAIEAKQAAADAGETSVAEANESQAVSEPASPLPARDPATIEVRDMIDGDSFEYNEFGTWTTCIIENGHAVAVSTREIMDKNKGYFSRDNIRKVVLVPATIEQSDAAIWASGWTVAGAKEGDRFEWFHAFNNTWYQAEVADNRVWRVIDGDRNYVIHESLYADRSRIRNIRLAGANEKLAEKYPGVRVYKVGYFIDVFGRSVDVETWRQLSDGEWEVMEHKHGYGNDVPEEEAYRNWDKMCDPERTAWLDSYPLPAPVQSAAKPLESDKRCPCGNIIRKEIEALKVRVNALEAATLPAERPVRP